MKYFKNVVTLVLDQTKCTGCTLCTLVCPHGVFIMHAGKATLTDRDRCMECGACAQNCAFEAISVKAGVGCASAIINGWLTGKEPSCDCGGRC
ncbi:MAG: 4Fe-4S dicluster domain-containing protein [Deltaproteobacteria bacterium]|nr:4Fe-4S dicluster domain-containing protein [Deltaproteobacteria bacterium]NCP78698.1 4Fe-4S dicluster domain-containing protein [Desulfuromonadales bacterium]